MVIEKNININISTFTENLWHFISQKIFPLATKLECILSVHDYSILNMHVHTWKLKFIRIWKLIYDFYTYISFVFLVFSIDILTTFNLIYTIYFFMQSAISNISLNFYKWFERLKKKFLLRRKLNTRCTSSQININFQLHPNIRVCNFARNVRNIKTNKITV